MTAAKCASLFAKEDCMKSCHMCHKGRVLPDPPLILSIGDFPSVARATQPGAGCSKDD